MGDFEIFMGVMHMVLLAPHMIPLKYARNRYNSTTATGWKTCQPTTRPEVAGALLLQRVFIIHDYTVMASVAYLPGDDNTLVDAASL